MFDLPLGRESGAGTVMSRSSLGDLARLVNKSLRLVAKFARMLGIAVQCFKVVNNGGHWHRIYACQGVREQIILLI